MLGSDFVVGMASADYYDKKGQEAIKNWQRTGDPKWLDKAEEYEETRQQFTYYGVTSLFE